MNTTHGKRALLVYVAMAIEGQHSFAEGVELRMAGIGIGERPIESMGIQARVLPSLSRPPPSTTSKPPRPPVRSAL
jgi:hypothetical protein